MLHQNGVDDKMLKYLLKLIPGIVLSCLASICLLTFFMVDESSSGVLILLLFTIILIVPGIVLIVLAERERAKLNFTHPQKVVPPDSTPQGSPPVSQMLEIPSPLEHSADSSVIGENEGFKANITDFFEVKYDHIDPDENIPPPKGAQISYLDACALNFWDQRRTDFQVPPYYENTAFGRNVGVALERLLDDGYLRRGGIEKSISLKLVPELKAILSERELKVSGKKAELVQRILDNIPIDELKPIFSVGVYEITEKGKNAQQPYAAIFESQKHRLDISKYRLIQAKEKHPTDSTEKILLTALKDDLDSALQNGQKDEYQRTAFATAGYLEEQNELYFALQYYCLAYFLWIIDAQEWISGTGGPVNRNMTAYLADVSLTIGMSLDELIAFFTSTIKNTDIFCLATKENIETALHYLRAGLGVRQA